MHQSHRDPMAPRRNRATICPLAQLADDLTPEHCRRLLTRPRANPTDVVPLWLTDNTVYCPIRRSTVGRAWAFDVCLSSWSRDCPWRDTTPR